MKFIILRSLQTGRIRRFCLSSETTFDYLISSEGSTEKTIIRDVSRSLSSNSLEVVRDLCQYLEIPIHDEDECLYTKEQLVESLLQLVG
jgi:hypothetical protein